MAVQRASPHPLQHPEQVGCDEEDQGVVDEGQEPEQEAADTGDQKT